MGGACSQKSMKEVNFHAGVALFGRCLKLEAEYLDEDGTFPKSLLILSSIATTYGLQHTR